MVYFPYIPVVPCDHAYKYALCAVVTSEPRVCTSVLSLSTAMMIINEVQTLSAYIKAALSCIYIAILLCAIAVAEYDMTYL